MVIVAIERPNPIGDRTGRPVTQDGMGIEHQGAARGGNIGFHEIPYQYGRPVQTVDQLGDALSGGCVRQAPADALWMWEWAQLGTGVVVLP